MVFIPFVSLLWAQDVVICPLIVFSVTVWVIMANCSCIWTLVLAALINSFANDENSSSLYQQCEEQWYTNIGTVGQWNAGWGHFRNTLSSDEEVHGREFLSYEDRNSTFAFNQGWGMWPQYPGSDKYKYKYVQIVQICVYSLYNWMSVCQWHNDFYHWPNVQWRLFFLSSKHRFSQVSFQRSYVQTWQ